MVIMLMNIIITSPFHVRKVKASFRVFVDSCYVLLQHLFLSFLVLALKSLSCLRHGVRMELILTVIGFGKGIQPNSSQRAATF